MELVIALAIAVLAGSGTWLLLRPRTFQVVIGLSLLSYAVNLFIVVMGWVRGGVPPVVGTAGPAAVLADPLPQALVLTAIVISFGMTAVVVLMALGAYLSGRTDHINLGAAPDADRDAGTEVGK